jgi:hypothetical protein
LKERNRIVGKRDPRVDRNQRQIGLARLDPRGQCRQAGFIDVRRGGQHRGRLNLLHRTLGVPPFGLDDRKQSRDIEHRRKRRRSCGRYDQDQALLGHLATRIRRECAALTLDGQP